MPGRARWQIALSSDAEHARAELFRWTEEFTGRSIVRSRQTAGGNRMRSWVVELDGPSGNDGELFLRYSPPRPPSVEPYTLAREAEVYRAIDPLGLKAPRLLAVHPELEAMLTTCVPGSAELRRLPDDSERRLIVTGFMEQLARLHARPQPSLALPAGVVSDSVADHVRAELATWRAMYDETGARDGLIETALAWLDANIPEVAEPPVLTHGDAGPGNFMFDDGQLSGVIDWELAHVGDPMEDLAWFSMRCVMEPVPDFAQALQDYARAAGRPIDTARILYHRVFVSTRVVIIRHRNVTGSLAPGIISRALNRRLLVEALAQANRIATVVETRRSEGPTDASPLFAHVLEELRSVITPRSADAAVIASAKSIAKIVKYLDALDRDGAAVERRRQAATAALVGGNVEPGADAEVAVAEAVSSGRVGFEQALAFFADRASDDALLAAGASGGIARRSYPPLVSLP